MTRSSFERGRLVLAIRRGLRLRGVDDELQPLPEAPLLSVCREEKNFQGPIVKTRRRARRVSQRSCEWSRHLSLMRNVRLRLPEARKLVWAYRRHLEHCPGN